MSVFSKIRQSRAAAKKHKAKTAGKGKETGEVVKIPYKHVPKHAAVDALSGAPSTWKQEDIGKIRKHHQRRGQMGSRTTSTLSTSSYFSAVGGPSSAAPQVPRNNSYSSNSLAQFDRGGEAYHNTEHIQKRYKSKGHSYHDSGLGASIGPSPLASNMHSEDSSPAISSGHSSSSNSSDHLEIAPTSTSKRSSRQRKQPERIDGYSTPNITRASQRPQPTVYAEKDIFQRLHTSTTRKIGEAPLHDGPLPPVRTLAATTATVSDKQKQKKSRWSLLGKRRNSVAVV